MNRIQIPGSDIIHSKAVFGTSRLGGTVERFDKKEALTILNETFDAGINAFDTADIYAQGNAEKLLAEVFRNRRDQIVLGTKGGYVISPKARMLSKLKPVVRTIRGLKKRQQSHGQSSSGIGLAKTASKFRGGQMAQNFSKKHLITALHASLKRLRTDTIDIYQLHSPSAQHLTESDAFETLSELKSAGKIRAYGASLLSWDDVDFCTGKGASWIQVEGDLTTGNLHNHWQEKAKADGLILMARQIFGSGLLLAPSTALGQLNKPQKNISKILNQLGDPAPTLLRYLHHHSPFPSFLFATTRLPNLKRNLQALNQPPFSKPDLDLLREILPTFHIPKERTKTLDLTNENDRRR